MRLLFAGLLACVGLVGLPANAATIFQVDSATTTATHNSPTTFGYIDEVINQDGLAANYVSGVTDFESFLAATSHTGGSETFGSFDLPLPITFDFSFNSLLNLDRMALWNQSGTATLDAFDLYASASGSFTDLLLLGSYNAASGYAGEAFYFAATNVMGVRMVANSNQGHTSLRFTEVAFGGAVAAVPLPASALLLVAGFGVMGLRRRRC